MAKQINTDEVSSRYRAQAVNVAERRLLITNLAGTDQAEDLQVPPNCNGFGRIRHFCRATSNGWPENPLPIDPIARKLGLSPSAEIQAQVFQNAVCNWRCWYCYVPFDLLSANNKHSAWLTAAELIDLYLAENQRPVMIDLSGGQPDLVPEWIPWTMEALIERGLADKICLWSDDNLSNDFFWQFLTPNQQALVASYKNYAKVCCFKGFDPESFALNTRAAPELFERQFDLFRRYLGLGLDLYAYATFTGPSCDNVAAKVAIFVDRLQGLHPNLPLRLIPLEIRTNFKVVGVRISEPPANAMKAQQLAIDAWNTELGKRFSSQERETHVADVPLR